jgi:peptidoglycan/LPS O-acetylase OafA/YrhL
MTMPAQPLPHSVKERFAWFDCLRFTAIVLVIFSHCPDITPGLPGYASTIFNQLHYIGWAGVDLFFVLSGFLVSGLLFDEYDTTGALDIKRFLIRRGFKIIPAFYVLTAFTVVYQICFNGGVFKVKLFHDIFFLQSYLTGSWGHAWTLSVEVHFYILLALLLAFLARRHVKDWLKPLPWIICVILFAVFLLRLGHSQTVITEIDFDRDVKQTHLHLDVLAAGVLLRYIYNYHRSALAVFERGKLLWITLALLLVYPSAWLQRPHPFYLTALIPTFNWMGFSLILFQATQISFPVSRIMKWLVWPFDYFGKHSYGIYLWHMPVKVWLIDWLIPDAGLPNVLGFFAGSLLVGTFFSEILEMPLLRLRNRLFPSKTK